MVYVFWAVCIMQIWILHGPHSEKRLYPDLNDISQHASINWNFFFSTELWEKSIKQIKLKTHWTQSVCLCVWTQKREREREKKRETDRTNLRAHLAKYVWFWLPTCEKCQLLSLHLKLLWRLLGCIKAFHLASSLENIFSQRKSALIIESAASSLLVFFGTSFKWLSKAPLCISKRSYWF